MTCTVCICTLLRTENPDEYFYVYSYSAIAVMYVVEANVSRNITLYIIADRADKYLHRNGSIRLN